MAGGELVSPVPTRKAMVERIRAWLNDPGSFDQSPGIRFGSQEWMDERARQLKSSARGRLEIIYACCPHALCLATVDRDKDAECIGCKFGWAE